MRVPRPISLPRQVHRGSYRRYVRSAKSHNCLYVRISYRTNRRVRRRRLSDLITRSRRKREKGPLNRIMPIIKRREKEEHEVRNERKRARRSSPVLNSRRRLASTNSDMRDIVFEQWKGIQNSSRLKLPATKFLYVVPVTVLFINQVAGRSHLREIEDLLTSNPVRVNHIAFGLTLKLPVDTKRDINKEPTILVRNEGRVT